MTISDMLAEQVRVRPTACALIDDRTRQTFTFAGLEAAVSEAAGWWVAQGLRRGQAVLVFVPMSADLYVALLALFRLGAVALFLDPSAGQDHLERCCARWAPDALLAISKAHLLRLRSAALRRIPLKVSVGVWVPGAVRWPRPSGIQIPVTSVKSAVDAADAALVTFTSGSTGAPKATVRTHGFLLAQYRALAPNLALTAGEVDLATLPVFVLANLAAGVTTVIPDTDLRRPGAVDAARIFAQVERHAVTRLTASPALMERLVAEGKRRGSQLRTVRKLHTGGAPVFPRLLEALQALAPHAEVVAVYGSTEAEPMAHISARDVTDADRTRMRHGGGLIAGHPVEQVRVAVINDAWGQPRGTITPREFEAARQEIGAIGEIVVTGEHVLQGYLGGVGDEATKFTVQGERWHRTGDAGTFDEQGRLWLMGRCSARIDDTYGRLYPFAVECIAMSHPEVRRAAVLAHKGQRILFVEAESNPALERELRVETGTAALEAIRFMPQLPVDGRHNAKIDYPRLRALVEREE